MLRLEGNDDDQQSDEENFSPELRSKEERKDSVSVKGQATVAFSRSGQVVKDFRQAEKQDALDESEEERNLATSISAAEINLAAD